MTQVKVYINESRDASFGFVNEFAPAVLRHAITFDLAEVASPLDRTLEFIFEQLNVGGDLVPATDWTTEYRNNGNRSLSVGDVVTIGETGWACASAGWKQVTSSEITAALSREVFVERHL